MENCSGEKQYIESCPLGCAAEARETDIVLPEGPLRECTECGQFFSQCSERFFHESMREFNSPSSCWRPAETHGRLARSTARLLASLEAMLGKGRGEISLLDVGCSRGTFLKMAASLGVNCEGVEPAPEAAAVAVQAGLKVRQGFLEDLGLPSDSYDVITLFEVIEHIRDPAPLLRECRRLLKKGGLLVIRTGNTGSWTASVLKGGWEYFSIVEHGGHISFFNRRSMGVLAGRTGLALRKFRTHSVSLTDHRSVSRLHHRLSKVLAELLNLPAKLAGRGQKMEVFLVKE